MELRERVVLVTGAGRRLGQAIAIGLARAGAHVAVHFHTSIEEAAETARRIQEMGMDAEAFHADLRDPSQIRTLIESAARRFGRLDALVNAAAVMRVTRWHELTPELWDEILALNLRAPMFCAQAAARYMEEGVIINIADGSALKPWPDYLAHTVSKSGLVALTQALALALAPRIRVNAVIPGPILRPVHWEEERWAHLLRHVPLGRAGMAEEVAHAVRYLIEADYVTGAVLVVDGGHHLR
ncbi:SDR family oxidoreductase [Thermoflexus sp.]|uniref:SDR family NAD(P)-dependent oxidoreductase n=1 Tax=Thermoflexus sp. TaxID=1969742 RepID=UPI0025DCC183|nr:SDR family oxidoreductase [Thermoflexus sp.]MDW8180337.1 SDR family oxidoreductase [Anaerolineae bacterium]MCS6964424.1 SDR family oxidoreductase [Thermoflexus sp.]MCS7350886.1 SDR family oxidoreductase [Thermoflexus sp.]MCX7690570.1 SDR family oxidoreductase [Thermoflexus sp.]MDW8185673.1 SDR family oxidoreductase [Anaerolineae bacterium]